MKCVTVFCRANPGNQPWFAADAAELGKILGERMVASRIKRQLHLPLTANPVIPAICLCIA